MPCMPGAASAEDMQPLAQRLQQQVQLMYFEWRAALQSRSDAVTRAHHLSDELRDTQEAHHQEAAQAAALQKGLHKTVQQLAAAEVRGMQGVLLVPCETMAMPVLACMRTAITPPALPAAVCMQAEGGDLQRRLTAAHEVAAQHLLDLREAQGQLQHTRTRAAAAEARASHLGDAARCLRQQLGEAGRAEARLQEQLAAASARLAAKHRLMAEVSKGFALAMLSLRAQQAGRGVLAAALAAERRKHAHLGDSLHDRDARLRDMAAQVRRQCMRAACADLR